MGELVEAALDAEVGAEREREDVRVGRQVAARVVADEQDRALRRDVVEAAHVGAEVEAREQPQPRQRLADVVGVALVEVGGRDARLRLARRSRRSARPAIGPSEAGRPGARRRAPAPSSIRARCRARSRARPHAVTPPSAASRSRARSTAGPAGRRTLCGSPSAGRRAARASRARAAARATVSIAVSITSWRPLRAHQVAPIASRSSAVGWIEHDLGAERRTLRSSRSSRAPRRAG